MTPHPDPSDLASDLADGLLSGEEAARAAATPEVAARVEEIHRLRTALREVPPAPELPKARTLAAAVEAGMDAHHQTSGSPERAAWQPWLAAAAIVAVVLGVGVFALRDSGDEDVTASSDMAEDSESSVDADGDGRGGESEANTDAAAPPPAPGSGEEGEALTEDDGSGSASVDLGPVANEDELASAVTRASRSSQAGEPRSPSDQQQPTEGPRAGDAGDSSEEELGLCPQLTAAGDSERGRSTLFATAALAGEPVWVHLYPDRGGEDAALLVATSSACVDMVERIVPISP